MNKFNYKKLTPFKWFVLENFPYIEADFDAITEYQLYCKVVEYLNNTIHNMNLVGEQMELVTDAMTDLQNYVNNYFDNLDVQNEINNKLNEMAIDGTLSQLISSFIETAVLPLISVQNDRIDDIENMVTSATSGSPKGAFSTYSDLTTADPDHDYIYVVISDGKWYYYDTSDNSWTAGGQYQTPISNDILSDLINCYSQLITKHLPSNIIDYENLDVKDGYYLSVATGDELSNDEFCYTETYIDLLGGENLYSALYNQNNSFNTLIGVLINFYTDDKSFISGSQATGSNQPIEIPTNAKYCRISILKNYFYNFKLLLSVTEYPTTYENYYEPYYTLKDTALDKTIYNQITVDANGSGDYTTIQGAISYINTQNDNSEKNQYIINIKPGNYNLGADITAEDLADDTFQGVFIPDFTTLKGLTNKEDVVLYCTLAERHQYISTLNFRGTASIENLTIIGTNTRYTIHDDTSQPKPYVRNVKNCYIKGISTYFSVVYGSGTYDGANWNFENTIIDGTQTGTNQGNGIPFTVHNSLGSTANRYINFKNCRLLTNRNQGALLLKTLKERVSNHTEVSNDLTYVTIEGTEMGQGNKGLELVEENASVYGSGCLYSVMGFANKNDEYTITTTDGLNYDNRVNLI